jgi:uncharacterized protein
MTTRLVAPILFVPLAAATALAQGGPPIIDMHLHAERLADFERRAGQVPLPFCVPMMSYLPPLDPNQAWNTWRPISSGDPLCPDPIWSSATEEGLLEETIAVLRRRNIIGVLSGSPEEVSRWKDAAPDRLIPAVQFNLVRDAEITPDSLRQLAESGVVEVFGEITNQYTGIAPGDRRMDSYWAVAEELDLPVAIHMGEGRPGEPYIGGPEYRVRLGSPLLLEDVLVRHPRLRVYVMHYGSPLVEEMIAVMQIYPQVYVDLGGNQWLLPRAAFYRQLEKLIDAGFGKRIMFGSDQLIWPGLIEFGIATIEEAPFLSEEQKRDILYHNAARFLRLSEAEIARHHGR